jgi:hypothetical protein
MTNVLPTVWQFILYFIDFQFTYFPKAFAAAQSDMQRRDPITALGETIS